MSAQVTAPGVPAIEFRVLGPLEAVSDGLGLDLGPPKQRAVLASLLLAEGRVVSTDRLIEAVWGDDPPPRAQSGVQVYISKLRRLLESTGSGETQLHRRPPGYVLRTPQLDVVDFRRLSQEASEAVTAGHWSTAVQAASAALALWRGPLLADLADEPWVALEAARVGETQAHCSESLITALLGQDRIAEAVARSLDLVEAQPLREHGWYLRIVALHRAGRTPEALDACSTFSQLLDDQLGLEPGPELRALQTAMLRHDPSVNAWPGPGAPDSTLTDSTPTEAAAAPGSAEPAEARPVRAQSAAGGAIIGRADELAAIAETIEDVGAGRGGSWILLTGPPGIGKTRLAAETAALAADRGFRVVWTSCPDDDGTPAWWPLRPVIAAMGADPDSVFLPPAAVDADTVRFTVYENVSAVLEAASAQRPVLLIVDDAQWLDLSSLRCFGVLARFVEQRPITVVLTVRDREARPEVHDLMAALDRHHSTLRLEVPPLDARAATALLNQVADEPLAASEAFTLNRRTGGNPLLLSEYARLPHQERSSGRLPFAARSLLDRRLRGLPEPVLVVLRAAAVIGDVFELDLLAEITGLAMIDVIDRLDAAARDSIIAPASAGHGYQFGHALLRDAVIEQMSVLRRQATHARIAEVLDRRDANSHTMSRRAQHLSAALPIVGAARVVQGCSAAAWDAEARSDWDGAAKLWGLALDAYDAESTQESGRRDELMVARLITLARAGRGQTVLDAVSAGLLDAAAHRQTVTVGLLARVLLRVNGGWPWPAYGADPALVRTRLTELLPTVVTDHAAHARVLAALAVGNAYSPDLSVPERQSRQALEIATGLGDLDVLADAVVGRLLLYNSIGAHHDETIELLERLQHLDHEPRAGDEVMRHSMLTKPLFAAGDMDGVDRHLRAGIEGSDQLRLPVTRVQLRWMEATVAQWRGELDHADELVTTAYARHRQTELYSAEICYAATYLSLLWHRGQVASRADIIAQAGDPAVWGVLAAAESGDRSRGVDLVTEWLDAADPVEHWYTLGYLTLLGHGAADLRAVGPARTLLTRLEPSSAFVAAIGQTGCVGPVALATARLRALLGDTAGAVRDLAIAKRLAIEGGGRTALLRTSLVRHLLQPATPERTQALRVLAEDAARIGMSGVAAEADRAASG